MLFFFCFVFGVMIQGLARAAALRRLQSKKVLSVAVLASRTCAEARDFSSNSPPPYKGGPMPFSETFKLDDANLMKHAEMRDESIRSDAHSEKCRSHSIELLV